LVALSNFKRLSFRKGAYAALSGTAGQVRSGQDDKGRATLPSASVAGWGGRNLLHVEEAALDCDHDCVRTIAGPELGENALEMSFDGVL